MAKKPGKDLVVGIDIGTSKVVTLVGEPTDDGIQIIGMGSHPSEGLKRGMVVNIESTVQSIQRSVELAEEQADCEIFSAYTGIAGAHIGSINSHGMVAIRDREVTQDDVHRVVEAAKAVPIPPDQKMLHIVPQEFIIDQQGAIQKPVGMSGHRLEAKVHIVTGAVSATQNIVKCMKRCGLAADIVLEQFASSESILTPDEKNLGVCLIDIGGGTSDIAIFTDGCIRYTAVIPIAGDQVTNDIAIALRTPVRYAEEIKIQHGCAARNWIDLEETIDIPGFGDRSSRCVLRSELVDVIEARYEELFTIAANEIRRSGLRDMLAAGIVLTGGASKVECVVDLAERIFNMPVRVGAPLQHVSGPLEVIQNPIFATGVGLLIHGLKQRTEGRASTVLQSSGMKSVWTRMRNWFQGNF